MTAGDTEVGLDVGRSEDLAGDDGTLDVRAYSAKRRTAGGDVLHEPNMLRGAADRTHRAADVGPLATFAGDGAHGEPLLRFPFGAVLVVVERGRVAAVIAPAGSCADEARVAGEAVSVRRPVVDRPTETLCRGA